MRRLRYSHCSSSPLPPLSRRHRPLLSQFCETGSGAGQVSTPLESPPIPPPAASTSPTLLTIASMVQRLGSLRQGLGLGSPRRQKRIADLHRADRLPEGPERGECRTAQSPRRDRPRQLGQRLRSRLPEFPRAEVRSRRALPADVRRRRRPGAQPPRKPLHRPIHRRRRYLRRRQPRPRQRPVRHPVGSLAKQQLHRHWSRRQGLRWR